MKDEELKLEEIEASHTLGGYRRCDATLLSDTLLSMGLAESATARAID